MNNRKQQRSMMLEPKWVLASGAATAVSLMIGACAHNAAKRIPAADGPLMQKHTANFTLIRDKEIQRFTRVYHGTPNSKVARVAVSNPDHVVACQVGMPESAEAAPALSAKDVIAFEPTVEQDIYCSVGAGEAPVVPIQVDYLVPRAAASWTDVQVPERAHFESTLQGLKENTYSIETKALLAATALLTNTTVKVLPPQPVSKKAADNALAAAAAATARFTVAAGDLFEIGQVDGGIGASRRAVDTAPILPSGLTAAQEKRKTQPATRRNEALIFPAERANRLICTFENGGREPEVIFRGGEEPISFSDKEGLVECRVNGRKKSPERLQGAFNVQVILVHKQQAMEQLTAMTQAQDEGKAAFEMGLDAKALEATRNAAQDLVDTAQVEVEKYQRIFQRRAQELEQARYAAEQDRAAAAAADEARRAAADHERRQTDAYFPAVRDNMEYRRGGYHFSLVPVKNSVTSATRGKVDYVKWIVQAGNTVYIPREDGWPKLRMAEQAFTPVSEIITGEHWVEGVPPQEMKLIMCGNKMAENAQALNTAARFRRNNGLPTRETILKDLAKVRVDREEDCDSTLGRYDWVRLSFTRQNVFRFVYTKTTGQVRDALDMINVAAYRPQKIGAYYLAPNGARFVWWLDRDEKPGSMLQAHLSSITKLVGINLSPGANPLLNHPFFATGTNTNVPVKQSGSLKAEIVVDKGTLFPSYPNNVIEGFSLTQ